jgi:hypothetical protein
VSGFVPTPGLHVIEERNPATGRPQTRIVECHDLPPHDVIGSVAIRSVSQLQALRRRLKAREDVLLEETRARVRPEACHGGGQVPRRPRLDEMDGEGE